MSEIPRVPNEIADQMERMALRARHLDLRDWAELARRIDVALRASATSGAGTIRERLREIRAREQKATRGPWEQRGSAIYSDDNTLIYDNGDAYDCYTRLTDADWEFIARAREDVAWLLDQLEAASALPGDGSQ